jgi:hypothetical protein
VTRNSSPWRKKLKRIIRRWKDLSCSWISRINIVKIAYQKPSTVNVIPIKILLQFFTDLERTILNFIWKNKYPWIAKTNLYNKKTSRCITVPDFLIYYRAIVIKTAWYWFRNRHVDQWNQKEEPEINIHVYL